LNRISSSKVEIIGRYIAKSFMIAAAIVAFDESGLSEQPHRCRTWAPLGQTPVLQFHFNWKTPSVIAGITWWTFYFRLFPGTVSRFKNFSQFWTQKLNPDCHGCRTTQS
jgi:hypothetical protein